MAVKVSITKDERKAILAEYEALRAEILRHIENRTNLLIYISILTSTLIGYAFAYDALFLLMLIPIITCPILMQWVSKEITIKIIASYIKNNTESKIHGIGWETWLSKLRKKEKVVTLFSAIGIGYFYCCIGVASALYYFIIDRSLGIFIVLIINMIITGIIMYGLYVSKRV